MIRDFTKSAVSFSWALSLLTMKQGLNLLRPGQQSGDLFSPLTQVAVNQLDESMKGFFRSGDGLQTRVVDMAFSLFNPLSWFNSASGRSMGNLANPATWLNPSAWMSSAANFAQAATGGCGQNRSSAQAYSAPQGRPSGAQTAGPSAAPASSAPISNDSTAGWGPMPGDA